MAWSDPASNASPSIPRLILIPGLITLAVTLLRLAGELQHWSSRWFSATPYGAGSLVGITWLVPVFGIYFAFRLLRSGQPPKSLARALGLAVLAAVLFPVMAGMGAGLAQKNFMGLLVVWWTFAVAAAAFQYFGWPALFRTLLAYSLAARVPVAVIMFFAMRGQWGTHYDWIQPLFPYTGFWAKWVWLGLIPQLTLWVGFTIVVGALLGGLTAAIVRLMRRPPQSA